jgi:hypothetical protein
MKFDKDGEKKQELSSEERLLRLIRDKSRKSQAPDNLASGYAGSDSERLLPEIPMKKPETAVLKSPIDTAGHNNANLKLIKDFADGVRKINANYFIIGAVAAAVAIGLYFFVTLEPKESDDVEKLKRIIEDISKKEYAKIPEPAPETPGPEYVDPAKDKSQKVSFDNYQRLIKEKALFAVPEKKAVNNMTNSKTALSELAKYYKLVGIIPDDYPQAIIEDKKNQQTLFLKEGEMIDNIMIKSISTGKVIIACNGETATLSL